ncbi:MAG: PepSY-associated TM helix domain-containing protein [Blastomonas sp.]|nr:PepSY-associated TM helix domain-containing protein [Blastomonas sp.]
MPDGPVAPRPVHAPRSRKRRSAKQFWIKQLHSWHWISAAISLAGMFVFAVTGITLNHASTISAKPQIVTATATLPASALGLLERTEPSDDAPLPDAVRAEIRSLVGIDAGDAPAEWSEGEVYVAVPGPGSDAWVSIDRTSGAIEAERTDRGWVSFFNDLHKGRNTGTAWFWLIDVLAVACVIFTFTGLLLLQLHARHRPSTWPLVGLGTLVPAGIILLFMHF